MIRSRPAPEPKGKLDTMTATQIATGAVVPAVGTGEVSVNGPEDEVLDWWSIDWQQVENDVRRLRQRIFTASRTGT